jgi:SM-20-related protein
MLRYDVLDATPLDPTPFPHIVASAILPEDKREALEEAFPDIPITGFVPPEEYSSGGIFRELVAEATGRPFAERLGAKFGIDLASKPTLVTVRKWSESAAGRPHTDGADKIVTALIYLNRAWASEEGCLRILPSQDIAAPGAREIAPTFGNLVAFRRSENSWHGHLPFKGERRVLQIAWCVSEEAIARKRKRHGQSSFLKKLWPFGGQRPPATM